MESELTGLLVLRPEQYAVIAAHADLFVAQLPVQDGHHKGRCPVDRLRKVGRLAGAQPRKLQRRAHDFGGVKLLWCGNRRARHLIQSDTTAILGLDRRSPRLFSLKMLKRIAAVAVHGDDSRRYAHTDDCAIGRLWDLNITASRLVQD